jgi:hypothetical protein
MPPPFIKTVGQEILYEYAKLISRSAYGSLERPFITDRFKKLRDGEITMSGTIREWEREQELPKQCVYCGNASELSTDHLIPQNKGGGDLADNLVLACKSCNASKGDKGVFEWLGLEKKDDLHRLVAGKYLKELWQIHEKENTLHISKSEIQILCEKCSLPAICEKWNTSGKLSCFCLESVIK